MTRDELNRVLDLQNKAFGLLVWIDEQARHQPELLSDENVQMWKFVESCETWVRRRIGIFPRDLRPDEDDVSDFAHLMSSFFNTSFRVEEKNESDWVKSRGYNYGVWRRRKLVVGASTRKTKAQKEKQLESARNLQLIALEELAIENDVDLSRAQLENLAAREDLEDALNLYSYAHELLRRSQFASQGAAVHSLWNTIDKKTRQNLKFETIWQARETLVSAMRKCVL